MGALLNLKFSSSWGKRTYTLAIRGRLIAFSIATPEREVEVTMEAQLVVLDGSLEHAGTTWTVWPDALETFITFPRALVEGLIADAQALDPLEAALLVADMETVFMRVEEDVMAPYLSALQTRTLTRRRTWALRRRLKTLLKSPEAQLRMPAGG